MIFSPLDRLVSAGNGRPVLLDGGIGTFLMSRSGGVESIAPSPSFWLNVSEPEKVVTAHLRFLEAGAEILLVNSFCASRPFVGAVPTSSTVGELNKLAVEVARVAISRHGRPGKLVAGSIGPLPPQIAEIEHHDIFFEQAMALASSGVDLLVCETFLDSRQLACAAEVCREAASRLDRSIPMVGSMVPLDSESAKKLTRLRLNGLVDLIGLNCGADFEHSVGMLRVLSEQSAGPFWFKPSCGTPTIVNGVLNYPISPQTFASKMTELGKRVPISAFGGCCGASPDHIESLGKSLAIESAEVTQ